MLTLPEVEMPIDVSSEGLVSSIVLDRPDKANAYDSDMLRALDAAVAGIATPVVVVSSAGNGAFCGGADLDEMDRADPDSALDLYSQQVFDRIAQAPWVSIVAVQGAAIAGGFELALACDLRVAGPGARFALPETSLGLVPSAGGSTRLPRLVGPSRAKEVILGGRALDASTAHDWGLVARIADDPVAEAHAWAEAIARRDPLALRLAKSILDTMPGTQEQLALERMSEALLYRKRGE